MKYFTISSKTTVDDLKNRYRELCKTMHPDKGGNHSDFIDMGEEFRQSLNALTKSENKIESSKAQELLKELLKSIIEDPNTIYRLADLLTDKNRLNGIFKNILSDSINTLKSEILKS